MSNEKKYLGNGQKLTKCRIKNEKKKTGNEKQTNLERKRWEDSLCTVFIEFCLLKDFLFAGVKGTVPTCSGARISRLTQGPLMSSYISRY